jgi:hypothetical protein
LTDELEELLYKLDLDQLKTVTEEYEIECFACETQDEFVKSISESGKVTVDDISSRFGLDFDDSPQDTGDNMPDFEDAENLLKKTKTKFDSGDYNATIDMATEAINAGTTALNDLYGMGLSYAIKSSEQLIVNLKNMDIDTISVEQVLEDAKVTLEKKEFDSAQNIVGQLKESLTELSEKQGEKISQILSATQGEVEEARKMGVDVAAAEAKLAIAQDQINAKAITQALGTIGEADTLITNARESRISEINEMILKAETTVDEAKYLNAPVDEAERILSEARDALNNNDLDLAVNKTKEAEEAASKAKQEQIERALSIQQKMMAASTGASVETPMEIVEEPPQEEASFEVEEPQEISEPAAEEPQVEEPQAEEPKPEEPKEELAKVCPNCEGDPTYVEQYDRHFCYTCNEYIEPVEKKAEAEAEAPKEEGAKVCPKCEGDPTYVEQYDRHFCYTCNEYVEPVEKKGEVKAEEPEGETAKVCPTCSGEPKYVEQYDRHFCYTCNEYIEPVEKKGEAVVEKPKEEAAKVCPTCSGEPKYVEQYDRHFCYTCNEYVEPVEKKAEAAVAEPKKEMAKVCPTCQNEPTYVEQYKKYYCYTCSKYVEPTGKAMETKSDNTCPTCGKEAKYVEQYGRNYCYDCKKYV